MTGQLIFNGSEGARVTCASVILAIRTARREHVFDPRGSNRDWDKEIHFVVALSAAPAELRYRTTL